MMLRSKYLAASIAALIAAPLAAAGGGGGGGGAMMPSQSAPQYDPAAEYQKGAAVGAALGGAPQALAPSDLPGSPEAADAVYVAAVAMINEGRYEAAIGKLEQAVWDDGPHPDLLTYLGFANRKLKRYDVARAW